MGERSAISSEELHGTILLRIGELFSFTSLQRQTSQIIIQKDKIRLHLLKTDRREGKKIRANVNEKMSKDLPCGMQPQNN